MKIATWSASCVVSELNSRFMLRSLGNKYGGMLISPPSGMDAKYIRAHRGMHLPCAAGARPVPILVTADEDEPARAPIPRHTEQWSCVTAASDLAHCNQLQS